jgi:membrane-bound inhibitor of C-type lysozyme
MFAFRPEADTRRRQATALEERQALVCRLRDRYCFAQKQALRALLMSKFALSAALLLPLVAAQASASSTKANYKCDDGTRIVATFHNPRRGSGSVGLFFPNTGKQMNLPQGMSADGGRYVSGKTIFWIKGRQATLTRGHRNTTCGTRS